MIVTVELERMSKEAVVLCKHFSRQT